MTDAEDETTGRFSRAAAGRRHRQEASTGKTEVRRASRNYTAHLDFRVLTAIILGALLGSFYLS